MAQSNVIPGNDNTFGAVFRDFSGGLVDNTDPALLQANQSPDLANVQIDNPAGSLKPRLGYTQCGITPTTNTVTAAYNFQRTDGSRNLILSDNNTIWSTQNCVTFSTITTGLGFSDVPSFATVRNKLWIVNGSTHAITWDGTTTTILDGRSGTPNPSPPKGRYIEFWKERVWIGRTSQEPSAIQFSALTDTSGNDIDPSTGSAAWPVNNAFYIDQDAGSPLYGIRAYRDGLYGFKENGIWRVNFNTDFDNSINKTLAFTGTRYNTSIAEHDNLLYFVGKDGIYAFDGDNALRVSEPFKNRFAAVSQSNVGEAYKTWDTDSDFNAGTLSSVTVESGQVFITSRTSVIKDFEDGLLSPWTCDPGSGRTVAESCGPISSSSSPGGPYIVGSWAAKLDGPVDSSDPGTLYIFTVSGTTIAQSGATVGGCTLSSLSAGSLSTYTVSCAGQVGQQVYLHFTGNGAHLYSSSFTIGTTLTFQYLNTAPDGLWVLDNFQSRLYFSSAVWTSEIYNMVTVSTWSTFEAESTLNGGNIAYSYRVGTSGANLQAKAFTAITPGSNITGTASETFIQVKSTFTADANLENTPILDLIRVNAITGSGSTQLIYSYSKDGNLYVSAATGTATSNNIVFVKARQPLAAWSIYDWKVGPMVSFGDNFYAAASSHPAISRMNYGTNDNGGAIQWYWTSRSETWQSPFQRKYLLEIMSEFRKGSASAVSVGYSRDSGSSYTNRSVDMSGSGRGLNRSFVNGGNAYEYRLRVGGSGLDQSSTILGLTGWARIERSRH